jgi:spermidine synthase
MPLVKNVLVLGAGLGSMVYVLHKRGYHPHFTLVENDKVILRWAMELLDSGYADQVTPICSDAMAYMEKNSAQYDLIFIDIFSGRVVPDFVFTPLFLRLCHSALAPGGHVAFNYIINDDGQWARVRDTFSSVFKDVHIVDLGINRVMVGGESEV